MWETYILTGIFIEDSACCGHVLLLAGIPLDTANRAICHRERVDKALPASAEDRKYAHTPASAGVNGPWSVPTAFASTILCYLGLELIPVTWGSARGWGGSKESRPGTEARCLPRAGSARGACCQVPARRAGGISGSCRVLNFGLTPFPSDSSCEGPSSRTSQSSVLISLKMASAKGFSRGPIPLHFQYKPPPSEQTY